MELRYVVQLRNVRPSEQMVHSFLEVIPLALIAVIAVDVAIQVRVSGSAWTFSLRSFGAIGPVRILAPCGAAGLLLVLGPFTEEALRCYRMRQIR